MNYSGTNKVPEVASGTEKMSPPYLTRTSVERHVTSDSWIWSAVPP